MNLNIVFQDGAENRKVHAEIVNVILEFVKNVFGGAGNPGIDSIEKPMT